MITAESVELTERHRLEQARLRAITGADLATILPLLDWEDLQGSWESVERLIVRLIEERRAESAATAMEFYGAVRSAEQIAEPFVPAAADELDLSKLVRNLRITGPGHAGRALYRGDLNVPQSTFVSLEGEVSRNVLNGGRSATLNTLRGDKQVVGWVRITDGNPCAFCAMLASRGPVYKSRQTATAGIRANRDRRGQSSSNYFVRKSKSGATINDFQAHPHCGCTAKPVYAADDPWPDRNQRFRELWDDSTQGFSGRDALNAFRRALAQL